MIKKLRRNLVLMVMLVVAFILLAIFLSLIITTQKNNERMSMDALHQALNMRSLPDRINPPFTDNRISPAPMGNPQMRLPVLIVEIDDQGEVSAILNQLHFIEETDIAAIAELALSKMENAGTLSNYALRYLRENNAYTTRIAFIDISIEQEMLKTQIINSLLVGGLAMLAFLILSLFLARWAVRPVEIAWEQQKQFIANASHELKTPLTVILSNADMLRSEDNLENSKNVRRVDHIHAEAVRMKQLVEDMLILAKSDRPEKAEVHDIVDFSYIVNDALLMYEPIIYDEDKVLAYEIEDNLKVRGDAFQLQQAVHILLDNARKYSLPRGAIQVRLSKTEHRGILLKVANEATPLSQDDLKNIFVRFYQGDESRSEHGSFGLGLSIAQSIVDSHKGKIWADSDGQSSNSFYISLPLL